MTRFSEEDVFFVLNARVDARGNDRWKPLRDLRQMGCPDEIFEKVLDQQVQRIGPNRLAEFRSSHVGRGTFLKATPVTKETAIATFSNLESEISGTKLF